MSWDTFAFLGRFQIHTGPTPSLTQQTMLDACIQNFFRVSTLYRVGGEKNAGKFRKGCTVLWGNPEWQKNMNIALLSQGLLSMIVATRFCHYRGRLTRQESLRSSRHQRKLWNNWHSLIPRIFTFSSSLYEFKVDPNTPLIDDLASNVLCSWKCKN